jgi:hypothetical protein
MLLYTLHGYWIVTITSIKAIPYSLVFRIEVVIPFKVKIPSLMILKEVEL